MNIRHTRIRSPNWRDLDTEMVSFIPNICIGGVSQQHFLHVSNHDAILQFLISVRKGPNKDGPPPHPVYDRRTHVGE